MDLTDVFFQADVFGKDTIYKFEQSLIEFLVFIGFHVSGQFEKLHEYPQWRELHAGFNNVRIGDSWQ